MASKLSQPPTPAEGAQRTSALPNVAIVGNPNAGKTSLFNSLTGSRQKVGNYPGVTVERVSARLQFEDRWAECVDVPGLYSLTPASEDEKVAVEAILGVNGPRPDLLVCVLDASNLERNLFFFSQLGELGIPMMVALTMVDRVEKSGRSVDLPRLSNLLGVDVVPVDGHRGRGMDELKEAIRRNLETPRVPTVNVGVVQPAEAKVAALRERLARLGLDDTSADIRRLLENPSEQIQTYLDDFPELREDFEAARLILLKEDGPSGARTPEERYRWAAMVQEATVPQPAVERQRPLTDRIDAFLTHRVFGLIVFVGVMYLVFQSIYTFAGPLMEQIENAFGWVGDRIGPMLEGAPILQSFVVDGLIAGVGGMLVFLPQILILFFFIAFLEGTGYLARAAFLMDKLLGWCGLNGRAFIPLLSSFACAIPGVMAARVMPDSKSRLATIMVAPLMSCSARLPVYVLLIGAFIQPQFGAFWAGFTLFAMHFLGLLVAIPVVWFINKKMLKGKRLPFLLELPPYQFPRWKDVWLSMYFRGKVFVKTAGTIIVFMSILIWALTYFPRSDAADKGYRAAYAASHPGARDDDAEKYVLEQRMANSFLGRFGRTIEPVFIPAGFDWRITTAILSAFPAREVVVPSLGIIFSMGEGADENPTDLRTTLANATWPDGRKLITPWTAVGLMGFFALCCQCMATLAAVKRETNSWKWPLAMFFYMSTLAYLFAVVLNQIGLRV
jgi:ferrous iron transport protein B